MDNISPNIKDRILLLADIKGIAKGKFLSDAGLNYNNFKGPAKKTQLQSDAIASLIKTYPDINPYWLLLGEGDILVPPYKKQEEQALIIANTLQSPEHFVPLYDIQNASSLTPLLTKQLQPIDHICVPNLPNIDGAITMRGETMAPEVRSGDLLLYRQVKDHKRRESIFFGQMYLLSFVLDDQEQITIKYIHESNDQDYITLVNKNSYYAPIDIPFESVQAVAMIKACLHYYDI